MYIFNIPVCSRLYALGSRTLYYVDRDQIFAFDLVTSSYTPHGEPRPGITGLWAFPQTLRVKTAQLFIMLDAKGKVLWEDARLEGWSCTEKALFHHENRGVGGFCQFDLFTGQILRQWDQQPYQGFCSFNDYVLFRLDDGWHWINGDAPPEKAPEWAIEPMKHGCHGNSGILILPSTRADKWHVMIRRNREYEPHSDYIGSMMGIFGAFQRVGERDIMKTHGYDMPQSLRDANPRIHFRRHGKARGHYSVEFWNDCAIRVYDHRIARPIPVMIALSRILPLDLLRLMMAYAG